MSSRRLFLKGLLGVPGGTIAACGIPKSSQSDMNSRSVGDSGGESSMKLESPAFQANSPIPARYTCDGDNLSPPLQWGAPPPNAQSLALIVDDPDAPGGTFVHWVIYDLPIVLRQLPAGATAQATLPGGGIQGKNDFGRLGYGGPCPPSGTHRYFFKLYALDRPLNLPQGATKAQLLQAMQTHILATAELVGLYQRQK